MLWTSARSSAIAHSIQSLLPKKLPPSLAGNPGNLYEVISRVPNNLRQQVHQVRWSDKQIGDSYWLVTRSKFKCEGRHGKAWGWLVWKGKLVSTQEERIRGSLKYKWNHGPSSAKDIIKS